MSKRDIGAESAQGIAAPHPQVFVDIRQSVSREFLAVTSHILLSNALQESLF